MQLEPFILCRYSWQSWKGGRSGRITLLLSQRQGLIFASMGWSELSGDTIIVTGQTSWFMHHYWSLCYLVVLLKWVAVLLRWMLWVFGEPWLAEAFEGVLQWSWPLTGLPYKFQRRRPSLIERLYILKTYTAKMNPSWMKNRISLPRILVTSLVRFLARVIVRACVFITQQQQWEQHPDTPTLPTFANDLTRSKTLDPLKKSSENRRSSRPSRVQFNDSWRPINKTPIIWQYNTPLSRTSWSVRFSIDLEAKAADLIVRQ